MGADSVIYIRADGNTEIATGHLVRCLSVARALKKEQQAAGTTFTDSDGFPITFLVSDQESKALLCGFFDCKEEFPVRILETARYDDPERELPELLALIDRCEPSHVHAPASSGAFLPVSGTALPSAAKPVLLVDSYFVTERYFLSLKNHVTLVYLDDLRAFDYPVDLVINYDILTPETQQEYENSYTRAGKKLLGGTFAPLRPQFQSAGRVLPSVSDGKICHVLIASGGSDPYHTTLHLTKYLLAECPPGYCFHLLLGSMNPDRQALCELADTQNLYISSSASAKASTVVLHQGISDMASLMQSCDLALSAAGTTLYELCAVGLPAVSYSFADNQLPSSLAFANVGAVPYAGDLRMDTESCSIVPSLDSKGTGSAYGLPGVLSAVCHFVTDMSGNMAKRKSAQQSMHRLIDGKGSCRIARALEECAFHNFRSP